MSQGKTKKSQRSIFKTANKYQDKIILLTFLPSALIFLIFIGIIFLGNPIVCQSVFHTTFPDLEKLVKQLSEWIVVFMCSIFLYSVIIAFVISNEMVGAFGRINRELDDIIAGRSSKTITCRPKDDLIKDLLKRVNVLVEYYAAHKHGK